MNKSTTTIISLGGSLIIPEKIDIGFLKKFRDLIEKYVDSGNKVVIVCGGGNLTRVFQKAAREMNKKVKNIDLDWIGISITRVNAQLVRSIFSSLAYEKIIHEPKKVQGLKHHIIVAGGWKPGWSTDYVAVRCAEYLKAREIVNLSNVAFIYDRDPEQFKDARILRQLTWQDMKKIVGKKWTPGAHLPFDPIATRLAARMKLRVVFLNGDHLQNLSDYLFLGEMNGSVVNGIF
jgi:uridylate kinase